jgi:DNA-binding NarL/FixJ family response regulator
MQHATAQLAEAELALARGDAEAALSASERLWRAWHLERELTPMSAYVMVPCLIVQAQVMMMSDRRLDAVELLQRAQDTCEDQQRLAILWRVEVLLGKCIAAEDETASQQYFSQARDHVHQLAEHLPEAMRQRFLERAEKLITLDNKRVKSAAYFQLTRRELDIAREIALGKTNQQIADELHITVKTVETHITRVLSKLEMTSRTQIALWITENRA